MDEPTLFNLNSIPKVPVTRMVLLELPHETFEVWLLRQLRQGTIDEEQKFTIMELRVEYVIQCWKDEILWERWRNNVQQKQ